MKIHQRIPCILICILAGLGSIYAQDSIRDVDFDNFSYQPDFCGGEDKGKITVKDGEFSEEKNVDDFIERIYFTVFGITYGDLDGDKKDEAVVLSLCNTGGTGNFTEAYIFKLVDQKPIRVAMLVGGDRAFGGLRKARIESGLLVVESSDAGELGGACCPEFIVTNGYRLVGNKLNAASKPTKREIYPATRINFYHGKFSKSFKVSMPAETEIKRFSVAARKGQMLLVTKSSSIPTLNLFRGNGEALQEGESLLVKLEKNGDYIFEIRNFSDVDLEYSVTVKIAQTLVAPKHSSNKVESIYTDLAPEKCKTIEASDENVGSYRGKCKGVGGFTLELLEGDIRQTINVVGSNGNKWELDLWSIVSSSFSAVGEKAEWRVRVIDGRIVPVALIVRFNANEDTENFENSEKVTSYLVVSKIQDEFICVTDIVKPVKNQNLLARNLADNSAQKPCLTTGQ